jgi:hypothetical protein
MLIRHEANQRRMTMISATPIKDDTAKNCACKGGCRCNPCTCKNCSC